MSRSEAAADLSVSERTFDKLLLQIPHFRIGRKILIRKSELRHWLEQHRVAPNETGLRQMADDAVQAVLESSQETRKKEL